MNVCMEAVKMMKLKPVNISLIISTNFLASGSGVDCRFKQQCLVMF